MHTEVENIKNIKLKVCTVNVGTLKGRSREVVSMLKRRHADLCCVQEVRYKNGRIYNNRDRR